MLRDPELAADLTQDAFVKAYRAYDSLEKPENARAWLYQIAHRVALDDLRRKRIVRFVPLVGETRNTAPSAEHLVMEARLSGELQRALERIPERQRAALLLAELHDLTGLELAAALGVLARRRPRAPDPGPGEPAPGARRGARRRRTRPPDAARAAADPPATGSAGHELALRPPTPPPDHDRARELAALAPGRGARPPRDAAWLEEHLAGCADCAAVAAAYDEQRLAVPRPP